MEHLKAKLLDFVVRAGLNDKQHNELLEMLRAAYNEGFMDGQCGVHDDD